MSSPLSNLPLKAGHLFIAGALIMAVATAVLFKMVLGGQKAEKPPEIEKDKVVVAADFVPRGTKINLSHIKVLEWPSDYLPEGEYYKNRSAATGHLTLTDLYPGEPVYKKKLAGKDSSGGLPVLIPDGHRAVSIAVSEIKGVAGFVKPGDFVDVLVTFTTDNTSGGPRNREEVTRTVLQNVLVLASAQSMVDDTEVNAKKPEALETDPEKKGKKKKTKKKEKSAKQLAKERKQRQKEKDKAMKKAKSVSSVTVALRPDQVEAITLAEEKGELRLSLRPEGDTSEVELSGVSEQDILVPPKPQQDYVPVDFTAALDTKMDDLDDVDSMEGSVELISGTTKSRVSF